MRKDPGQLGTKRPSLPWSFRILCVKNLFPFLFFLAFLTNCKSTQNTKRPRKTWSLRILCIKDAKSCLFYFLSFWLFFYRLQNHTNCEKTKVNLVFSQFVREKVQTLFFFFSFLFFLLYFNLFNCEKPINA